MSYDERHGGPYDRGGADYWYGRPFEPHYYKGKTLMSEKVTRTEMTKEQIQAYTAGYDDACDYGVQKDWG